MPNEFTTAAIMPGTSTLFVGPRLCGKTTAMFDVLRRIRGEYDYVIGITDDINFRNKLVNLNCLTFAPSAVDAVIDMMREQEKAQKGIHFLILFCCSMTTTANKTNLAKLYQVRISACTLLIEAACISFLPCLVGDRQDFVFAFNPAYGAHNTYFSFLSEKKYEYKIRKYVPDYSALVADTENKVYYVYTPQE